MHGGKTDIDACIAAAKAVAGEAAPCSTSWCISPGARWSRAATAASSLQALGQRAAGRGEGRQRRRRRLRRGLPLRLPSRAGRSTQRSRLPMQPPPPRSARSRPPPRSNRGRPALRSPTAGDGAKHDLSRARPDCRFHRNRQGDTDANPRHQARRHQGRQLQAGRFHHCRRQGRRYRLRPRRAGALSGRPDALHAAGDASPEHPRHDQIRPRRHHADVGLDRRAAVEGGPVRRQPGHPGDPPQRHHRHLVGARRPLQGGAVAAPPHRAWSTRRRSTPISASTRSPSPTSATSTPRMPRPTRAFRADANKARDAALPRGVQSGLRHPAQGQCRHRLVHQRQHRPHPRRRDGGRLPEVPEAPVQRPARHGGTRLL